MELAAEDVFLYVDIMLKIRCLKIYIETTKMCLT